jgi:hypothetical protein
MGTSRNYVLRSPLHQFRPQHFVLELGCAREISKFGRLCTERGINARRARTEQPLL